MKPRSHQKIRPPSQRISFIDAGDPRFMADAAIPVRERIDLATEAVVGARWLLLLACESLKGSASLEGEREQAARSLSRLDQLRTSLKLRRTKGGKPSDT